MLSSSSHQSHALGKPLCLSALLPHLTQTLTLHPWHDAISHTQCTSLPPLSQLWGRSCGVAADMVGWESLCKASLAWDEHCSNISGEICSSMQWSLVVTSEKVILSFWGTPTRYLCKEGLAGLTHTERAWASGGSPSQAFSCSFRLWWGVKSSPERGT